MAKFSMETLLGKKLLVKAGGPSKPTNTLFRDKKLCALYFSASWCPPCKAFSPVLAGFYETLGENRELEIVYVSSDRTVEDFEKYYATMPWLAIPPTEGTAAIKNNLAQTLGIRGIPTLIVIDAVTGEFISATGREEVAAIKVKEPVMCQQVIQLWTAQDRHPLDHAKTAIDNVDGGPIMKFFMFFARRPMYIFGLLYFYRWMMKKFMQKNPEITGGASAFGDEIPIMPDGDSEF